MTDQSNEEIVARFVSDHRPEAVGEDIFVAATGEGTVRTYGGAILSRAAAVASLTVEGKRLHSLHTYFLTAGDMAVPVRFAVTRVRDGRGYANRRIQATQGDRVLCDVIANFAAQDEGDARVAPRPPETPPPEAARDGWELLDEYPDVWMPSRLASLETRYVDLPWLPSDVPRWRIWVRPRAPLPDDPAIHVAASILISDMRSNGTMERVLGMSLGPASVISLDHAIWFHRPPRADDWVLLVTECTLASAGRAHMSRQMYTRDGTMFATVAQEMAYRATPA